MNRARQLLDRIFCVFSRVSVVQDFLVASAASRARSSVFSTFP